MSSIMKASLSEYQRSLAARQLHHHHSTFVASEAMFVYQAIYVITAEPQPVSSAAFTLDLAQIRIIRATSAQTVAVSDFLQLRYHYWNHFC